MTLASHQVGDPTEGENVAFVHGFTQTGLSWMPVIERLHHVSALLIDAPGHGDSDTITADLPTTGDLIAATMKTGTLVGYSMGARMALHAALDHPDVVRALVLVSGTPGIEDDSERSHRRRSDDTLADRIESMDLRVFIDEWLSNPMFSGLSNSARDIPDRLRNTCHGLAESLRSAGTGTQIPLWNRLNKLTMPVLIVCGDMDQKFRAIAERMHNDIHGSSLAVVEGAGHTVHLEQPDTFAEILTTWLSARE